jgi:hypothetical protein
MNAIQQRFCDTFKITESYYYKLTSLVAVAAKAQEKAHNEDNQRVRTKAQNATEEVEDFALNVLKATTIWPGLYPVFVKDDRQYEMPD